MPSNRQDRSPSIKNPDVFDALVDEGASDEKAARISNAIARDGAEAVGRRGGKSGSYADWTVQKLRDRAKQLGLKGYSSMRKADLIDLLREH